MDSISMKDIINMMKQVNNINKKLDLILNIISEKKPETIFDLIDDEIKKILDNNDLDKFPQGEEDKYKNIRFNVVKFVENNKEKDTLWSVFDNYSDADYNLFICPECNNPIKIRYWPDNGRIMLTCSNFSNGCSWGFSVRRPKVIENNEV